MTGLWASELSIAQRLRRPRRGSWPGGWGELGDRCSFLPCCQFRLSEWLKTKLSHTEICWVLVDCLGTLSLGWVCSYSLSFIRFAKIYCLKHCISGLILQKKTGWKWIFTWHRAILGETWWITFVIVRRQTVLLGCVMFWEFFWGKYWVPFVLDFLVKDVCLVNSLGG